MFIYINIDEMARISVFLAFVDVAFQFHMPKLALGTRVIPEPRWVDRSGVEGWEAFEWLELACHCRCFRLR